MTPCAPDFIEVFSGTWWSAGLLKSMLEDAGLEVFVKDEISGTSAFTPVSPGLGGVKLLVPRKSFTEARQVVQEYNSNMDKSTNEESVD